MVGLEKLEDADEIEQLWKINSAASDLHAEHARRKMLENWEQMVPKFVKVMPERLQTDAGVDEARRAIRPERRRSHDGCLRGKRPRRCPYRRRLMTQNGQTDRIHRIFARAAAGPFGSSNASGLERIPSSHARRAKLQEQGARCMDCGIPFCHTGTLISGMASGCPIQ